MNEIAIRTGNLPSPKTGEVRPLADDMLRGADKIAEFMFGNPGERRKSFLRPVFVIARNEDNALAHPKTFFPNINQWSLTKDGKGEKSAKAGQD